MLMMSFQVVIILKKQDRYGFHLRKWCSNNSAILDNIPECDQESHFDIQTAENVIKTLGMIWDHKSDTFLLNVSKFDEIKISKTTKRSVSSSAGSIFDQLGLYMPVTVFAKLVLQQLWKLKLDWDEFIPEHISISWLRYLSDSSSLRNVFIPRHVVLPCSLKNQLHDFSDASEKAYGAVIYVRSLNKEGVIFTNILCSKSKVSLLNKKTLAKLELCAATMLAELMNRIRTEID